MLRAASFGFLVPLILASCGESPPAPAARVPPVKEIAVGKGACQLTLLPDGRLLVNNMDDYSLSAVDLAEGREVRRIRFEIEEGQGEYLRSYALGSDGKTVWAAMSRGRIFEVDVDTGAATERFLDRKYYFNAIAEDPDRNRLVLGAEQEEADRIGLFALPLPDGEISRFEITAFMPDALRVVGSRLWYIARAEAIFGDGKDDSVIGIVDLARDRMVDEKTFERGHANALEIGPSGEFWVTDPGADRIVRFSPDLERTVVRHTGSFWGRLGRGSRAAPMELDLDEHRVYVSGDSKGVMEYERRGEFLSDFPVREYRVERGDSGEDPVGDVLCLPDGRLLVANRLKGILQVFGPEDAEPFEGFSED